MKHAVLEVRNGAYSLSLHPSPEKALDHATKLAQETDAHTDEEIAEYLKKGSITEGDWELHLLTAQEFPDDGDTELFHVCEKKDYHKAWGVFSRGKAEEPTKPFLLGVITYDYDRAVNQAKELAREYPEKHYSVQGAADAGHIPDSYNP